MTIWDVFALMGRFRLLAAALVLITIGAVAMAGEPHVVYRGSVRVILLPPEGTPGNALAWTTSSLVSMAGVVTRNVNGYQLPPKTVDPQVTLASRGVSTGYSVRQPDVGGQWFVQFEQPVLDVESVGVTPASSEEQMQAGLAALTDSLGRIQDSKDVPANLRIRVQLSPSEPVFNAQKGSRVRAMGAAALLGVLASLGLLLVAEELTRGSSGRRAVRARDVRVIERPARDLVGHRGERS